MDQARAVQALVGAEVVGHVAALLRDGCSHRGQIPPRVRRRRGDLWAYGKYLEVTPPSRLVWTNDEGEGGSVTTVTFEEQDGNTLLVVSELYPSKEALDEAIASGSTSWNSETFEQLDELLVALGASVERP